MKPQDRTYVINPRFGLRAGLLALSLAGCSQSTPQTELSSTLHALSDEKATSNTVKNQTKSEPTPEVSLKEAAAIKHRRECRLSELATLRVDLITSALSVAGADDKQLYELKQLAAAVHKQSCAGQDASKTQAAARTVVDGLETQLNEKLSVGSSDMSIVDALIGDSIQDFLERCLDPKQLAAIEKLAEGDLGSLSDEDYLALQNSMGRSDCGPGANLGGGGASRMDFLSCMQSAIDEGVGRAMVLCEDTAEGSLEDDLAEPEDPIDYLGLDDDDDLTEDEASTDAAPAPSDGTSGPSAPGAGTAPERPELLPSPYRDQVPDLLPSPYRDHLPTSTSEPAPSPSDHPTAGHERESALLPNPYGRRLLEQTFDQLLGGGGRAALIRPSRFCPAFSRTGGTPQRMHRQSPGDSADSATSYSPFISMRDVVIECRCRTGRAYASGTACGSSLTDPFRISCVVPWEPGTYASGVSPECADAFADDAPSLGVPECGAMSCDDGYELTPSCRCVPAGSDGSSGFGTDPCAHVHCGPDAVCTPHGCESRSNLDRACGTPGFPCLEDLESGGEAFSGSNAAQPTRIELNVPVQPLPRP